MTSWLRQEAERLADVKHATTLDGGSIMARWQADRYEAFGLHVLAKIGNDLRAALEPADEDRNLAIFQVRDVLAEMAALNEER